MKIPEKIKICGHEVRVEFEEHITRDRGAMGQSCGSANWIKLDESLPQTVLDSTFLHEIIEQINYNYELELPHNKITTLETALYQILHDNKLIF